jgi:diguanylate cyclase (GGDEF)-like protein
VTGPVAGDGGVPAWLDRVAVALALLSADGAHVLAANPAGRRLIAADGAGPWATDALLGAAAARALAAHLGAEPTGGPDDWLVVRCDTAAGARRLAVSARRCAAGWMATVCDHPHVPDADAPRAGRLAWQENLTALANWLPVGIEIYDADLVELFANAHSHRMFDYGGNYFGHHDDWWELGFPDPVARAAAREEWLGKVAAARRLPGMVQQSEWRVHCRDGCDRTVQFRYRFLDGFYVVVFWDVSEQRRIEAELLLRAGTDMLTGLPNRRRLLETARHLMRTPPFGLLMLDLDHFKAINDRFGHAVGDQALQAAADRCRRVLRDSDIIARVGGEEFAVLLPGTELETAASVAERLRAAVAHAPLLVGNQRLDLTASIGGTVVGAADGDLDDVLQRADRALYAAKAAGRNRSVFAEVP